jgi:thiamine biosynthesis protein ThiI
VLYLIPLAEAQRQVVMHTAPKYRVLLYRRLMMRVAGALVKQENASALVTGESIGQVASQTIPNLAATEAVASVPVFRPLIGDDKEEIITQAKRLGTYEISIQPHDDCCTLFIPQNPATGARIADLEREEAKLPIDQLVKDALEQVERIEIGRRDFLEPISKISTQ